jgi:outer membrane protein assembly factor BamB
VPNRSSRLPILIGVASTIAIVAVFIGARLVGTGGVQARADFDHPEWTQPVGGWPYSIAADAELAVVVADVVRALDPADGEQQWESDVPGAWLHQPALSEQTVLVSGGDQFVALERTSGEERWSLGTPEAGPVTLATDASGDEIALLSTETGVLAAADAATGRHRWSTRHAGELWAPPVVDAEAGVVAAVWSGFDDPRLRVVDLTTGRVEWDVAVDPYVAAPALTDGAVVVPQGDGNFSGRAVAYSVADGEELWSAPLPASFQPGTVPAADGGRVAVVDRFGTVTMLDAATGEVVWFTELRRPVLHTRVILTPSAAVVTDEPGEVVIIDRDDGEIRERLRPDGFPVGVAEAGERLLVALRLTDPGRVEAWPRP